MPDLNLEIYVDVHNPHVGDKCKRVTKYIVSNTTQYNTYTCVKFSATGFQCLFILWHIKKITKISYFLYRTLLMRYMRYLNVVTHSLLICGNEAAIIALTRRISKTELTVSITWGHEILQCSSRFERQFRLQNFLETLMCIYRLKGILILPDSKIFAPSYILLISSIK